MSAELIIEHNAGFFSCCSVRLTKIIDFFNIKQREPFSIDCTKQFHNYKINPNNLQEDLNNLYFAINNNLKIPYIKNIDFHWEYQFKNYKKINYKSLNSFIKKYFNPSNYILDLINQLEKKYSIDYTNTIGVIYRGNDKHTETTIASYREFIEKCQKIKEQAKPGTRFFLQTDEIEFKNKFLNLFSDTIFLEEIPIIPSNKQLAIHHIINQELKPHFGALILCAILILSKCKMLITHSGSCGLWSVLYRGHCNNVYQYLNHKNINLKWIS
jgi:hypothetical protein